jgi:perosamine synthetase
MQTITAPAAISAERRQRDDADFIPLCVPHLGGAEWTYVKDCLDSNWVSSVGPYVGRFERALADRLGIAHAVAAVNGTAALHIALLACGIEPEDEVIVPTLTFIAPANAVRYCGAWPIFFDVDPTTWQIDVNLVEVFLRDQCVAGGGVLRNPRTGRRIAAIVPVHVLGHPVDIEPLVTLARQYGLKVVEDATEALGSRYKDRAVGTHGDAACFSFNGNKLITTGGGGMIVTGDAKIAERAYYLTTQAKDDPVEYIHNEIGFNYRLTNVQSAIGCAQLELLERHIEKKRAIAARYRAGLPGLVAQGQAAWAQSICWLHTVLLPTDRREVLRGLDAANIQTRPLWQPLHMSRAHPGAQSILTGAAERVHTAALSLPSSVGLSEADQDRVIGAVQRLVRKAA